MAEGMPPAFFLKLLNTRDAFVRHGRLSTACVWLQSQMVGLICLHDSEELRDRCAEDDLSHLPEELCKATIQKLENWSSETLRKEFVRCFGSEMSEQLEIDVTFVTFYRDALAHGYLSLRQQIIGPEPEGVFWSPHSRKLRDKLLAAAFGPRPEGAHLILNLSEKAFNDKIARICRLMDFIALKLKAWDFPYPMFV